MARRLVACGLGPALLRGRRPLSPARLAQLVPEVVADCWAAPAADLLPELIVIAVPDDTIESVADQLAGCRTGAATVVLHTSGLRTADAIAACRTSGAEVASWHPLQSFPSPWKPLPGARWEGVPCAIEGDERALLRGHELARRLGLRPWRIDAAHKTEYHAAAAIAGNLSHVLVAAAAMIMDRCGLPRDDTAQHPLAPLVESSVTAALASPGLESLTGAIARNDRATVARHLAVLDGDLAAAYRAVASFVGRSRTSTWLD